jgi:N6-adenosine-specific RNA methylase IME4
VGASTLKPHPLAGVFPLLEGAEFDALVASIRRSGLRNSIIVYENKIIDGRNRERACAEIEANPQPSDHPDAKARYEAFEGDDPVQFVLDQNRDRRHLNPAQLAMAADALANLEWGTNRFSRAAAAAALTQAEAAERMRTSQRSLRYARVVKGNGSAKWVQAVWAGKCPIERAAEIAKLDQETQDMLSELPPADIVANHDRIVRDRRRAETFRGIMAETPAMTGERFPVIYADPPWRFEPYSVDTTGALADDHYATMPLEAIKGLDVPATDDAVLFLWATQPMLPHALETMAAWGFAYKSHFVWAKDRIGTGYWNRNKHEVLLVGTRGSIPAPTPGTQASSVIVAPVREHSEKPAIFHELIEAYYPTLPRIELFARGPARPGWAVWGAEAIPADAEPAP